jgi:hypothetical protein
MSLVKTQFASALAKHNVIWKERGRRIFQNESLNATALAGLIRADIELIILAKGRVSDP